MYAHLCIAASGVIVLLLGTVHLLYTFHGDKLLPRDSELILQMQQGQLRLTRETTVWRAWIGFNASHSLGAMLYGLIYGYLALAMPQVLWGSTFLLAVGALLLGGLVLLARLYWFSVPLIGVSAALVLYLGGLIGHGLS